LTNFEQYRQVVTCKQLMTALTVLLTTAGHCLMEDVLNVFKALAISGSGQKVM